MEATLGDDTVSPNYMLGASASVASRLLGADLKIRGTGRRCPRSGQGSGGTTSSGGGGQIREEGIARLDLDAIAASLNVAPKAVSYWFADETEVLVSIMQIRQRWFLDEADARFAQLPSYAERLKALIELCVADYDVTYWIELWKLGLRDGRARMARQTLRATVTGTCSRA